MRSDPFRIKDLALRNIHGLAGYEKKHGAENRNDDHVFSYKNKIAAISKKKLVFYMIHVL